MDKFRYVVRTWFLVLFALTGIKMLSEKFGINLCVNINRIHDLELDICLYTCPISINMRSIMEKYRYADRRWLFGTLSSKCAMNDIRKSWKHSLCHSKWVIRFVAMFLYRNKYCFNQYADNNGKCADIQQKSGFLLLYGLYVI